MTSLKYVIALKEHQVLDINYITMGNHPKRKIIFYYNNRK